jgi:DNA-binding NtrC family response regulator
MRDATRSTLHWREAGVGPLSVQIRAGEKTLILGEGTCKLGAGADCDLVIDEPTVSREHAELTLVSEGVALRDLGSRNGTFYMGHRVERMILAPRSEIRLGGARVLLEIAPEQLGTTRLESETFRGMIGRSEAMQLLFYSIARLDGSLVPVLVRGESGVGKELVARALHEGSRVASGPFVAVNCGALSRELVASALFGHRRGAFTGAADARKGAFVAADGGSVFLDEVGELPLDVQPLLLRALETSEIVPLGEDLPRKVSARVLAATHRDLAALVAEGRFREDLFYRLNVVELVVPPLRERREDVPLLAEHLARRDGVAELPSAVVRELMERELRGNVRELRNLLQSYLALGRLPPADRRAADRSTDAALAELVELDRPYAELKEEVISRFTRLYVARLLEHTHGNQTEAARIAGLERTYFGRLLAKLRK